MCIEALYCTLETNIVVYVNYASVKKGGGEGKKTIHGPSDFVFLTVNVLDLDDFNREITC